MEQMAIDPIAITNEVIYTDDVEIDDIVIRPSKQNWVHSYKTMQQPNDINHIINISQLVHML